MVVLCVFHEVLVQYFATHISWALIKDSAEDEYCNIRRKSLEEYFF